MLVALTLVSVFEPVPDHERGHWIALRLASRIAQGDQATQHGQVNVICSGLLQV
jgi:hypothetical protein